MFRNFYLVTNHKIANNSVTVEAIEKISTDLESLEFYKNFDARLTKLKNNQFSLNKICRRFFATTKLLTWSNTPIGHQKEKMSPGVNVTKLFPLSQTMRPNKLEGMSLETLSSQVLEFEGKAIANPIGVPFRCFLLG
jgi:hypothetical protein